VSRTVAPILLICFLCCAPHAAAQRPELYVQTNHADIVRAVAISPNGQLAASASNDKTVRLWDVKNGTVLRTLSGHSGTVFSLLFVSDKILLSGSHREIKSWDVTTGKVLREIPSRRNVTSMSLSSDGKILAFAAIDHVVLLDLALRTRKELRVPRGDLNKMTFRVAFRPSTNGPPVLATTFDNTVVLWDAATGQQLGTLEHLATAELKAIAFSPDGKLLAISGTDFWYIWDVEKRESLFRGKTLPYGLAFSPDGKLLASGSDDGLTKIWETETGKELRTLAPHRASVRALAFSPDNSLLATGSNDSTINIWDVATGNLQRTLTGYGAFIRSIVFSADGKTLVNGGLANKANVWDVATGRLLRTLTGHDADVRVVTYSPDGKFLFTCSQDATTKIWRESDGVELATMILLGDGDWMVVTPDGLFDGSPAAWQQIIWRFGATDNFAPVELFFADFYRPGLLADILAGKNPQAPSDISQKDRRQPQLALSPVGTSGSRPIATRRINVRIDVSQAPAGAQDVRLFRNGSLVRVWRGDVLKGSNVATLEATLPIVAGENRLTAYAFNRDNVKSADATLIITGDERLRHQGTAYIIAAGVNQYAPNPFFRNLKYAVADADSFASEVKSQQERLTRYERVEVIKLTDAAATKANILGALSQLATKAQPEDAVILYFAGHGLAQGGQFYLIPHDLGNAPIPANAEGLAALDPMLAARGISDKELAQAFEGVDAGQMAMIIDACNSGQALGANAMGSDR
jgi:WD40 repeat protein